MLIRIDLLKAAMLCASAEESRYYLRGVFFSATGHMVSTDGHRLFCAKIPEAPDAGTIVPIETIKAAIKLAPKKAVTIDWNGNTFGGVVFTPIDGTFPNWRNVIPAPEGYQSGTMSTPAHFNPDYIYDLGQMSRALGSKTGCAFRIHAWDQNSPHGVTFAERDDCFAVIMPMRANTNSTAPEWAAARAIA